MAKTAHDAAGRNLSHSRSFVRNVLDLKHLNTKSHHVAEAMRKLEDKETSLEAMFFSTLAKLEKHVYNADLTSVVWKDDLNDMLAQLRSHVVNLIRVWKSIAIDVDKFDHLTDHEHIVLDALAHSIHDHVIKIHESQQLLQQRYDLIRQHRDKIALLEVHPAREDVNFVDKVKEYINNLVQKEQENKITKEQVESQLRYSQLELDKANMEAERLTQHIQQAHQHLYAHVHNMNFDQDDQLVLAQIHDMIKRLIQCGRDILGVLHEIKTNHETVEEGIHDLFSKSQELLEYHDIFRQDIEVCSQMTCDTALLNELPVLEQEMNAAVHKTMVDFGKKSDKETVSVEPESSSKADDKDEYVVVDR